MAQPTCAEVTWVVDTNDSRTVNVFHYDKTGTAWAIGDAAALRISLQAAFLIDWPGVITTECTIVRCVVDIRNATFADTSDSGGLSVPGTRSGDTFPSGTAAILKKVTAEPGRHGRGRFFIGGLSEADHNDSFLNSALAQWPLLMAELATSYVVGPDTFIPSVWSRSKEDLYAITGIVANPVLGHMRTRRPPAY